LKKNGKVFEQLPSTLDHEVIQNKKTKIFYKIKQKFSLNY
jgi:hypothetical protein